MDEGGAHNHPGPLSDITVIEVAEGVAGPFCGRLLAGFGARVIKVERPLHGDWTRSAFRLFTPHVFGVGWSVNMAELRKRLGAAREELDS